MHKNIKLLLLASILIHSGTNLLAPIYAIFISDIGGNLLDAGVAVGIYALLKGILYFVFDKMDETRFNKRLMMFSGYTIMGVAYALYIFATIPLHVFLIQALLAVGETVINPSWSAVIAMSLQQGKERHIYSHFYGYRSLFEGVAAIAGGLFAMKFGFDLVFGVMAAFAFSSGLLVWMVDENLEPHRQ